MKNKTILGIVFALVIIPTAIAYAKEDGYFNDLSATGQTYLGDTLRVDGNTFFYGEIRTNDKQGFTGYCPRSAEHIYETGLLVECNLPSKEKPNLYN
jgi:hypothetical protein